MLRAYWYCPYCLASARSHFLPALYLYIPAFTTLEWRSMCLRALPLNIHWPHAKTLTKSFPTLPLLLSLPPCDLRSQSASAVRHRQHLLLAQDDPQVQPCGRALPQARLPVDRSGLGYPRPHRAHPSGCRRLHRTPGEEALRHGGSAKGERTLPRYTLISKFGAGTRLSPTNHKPPVRLFSETLFISRFGVFNDSIPLHSW